MSFSVPVGTKFRTQSPRDCPLPSLWVTVLPSVETSASFQRKLPSGESPLKLAFHDPRSHLAFLSAEPAQEASLTSSSSRQLTAGTELRVLKPEGGRSAVRLAGRVKLLRGQPTLLALLRIHTGGESLLPGSPIVDDQSRVVAFALSPLDETTRPIAGPGSPSPPKPP